MNELAPISITTYSRLNHLMRTVEALKNNALADRSILYIFSDAPKKGDELVVEKVREYLDTIDGFREVRIVKQKTNGYEKNIRDAYSIPLNEFGKFIRMEDDIVTSPHFLKFMNDALEFYENDKAIFAISGYTPAVDFISKSNNDLFLSKDFSAWGYATWKDRGFIYARERTDYYLNIKKNNKIVAGINKLHPLMMDMLRLIQQNKANPGDYKLSANLFLNNLFTIKPKISMVQNIGFDGGGNVCKITEANIFATTIDPEFDPSMASNLKYEECHDEQIFLRYFGKRRLNIVVLKVMMKAKLILSNDMREMMIKMIKKIRGFNS